MDSRVSNNENARGPGAVPPAVLLRRRPADVAARRGRVQLRAACRQDGRFVVLGVLQSVQRTQVLAVLQLRRVRQVPGADQKRRAAV